MIKTKAGGRARTFGCGALCGECETDLNIGAWEREIFVHAHADEHFCNTGSARRWQAGYPDVNEAHFEDGMTAAECLSNITNLTASGITVYAWGMDNEYLDVAETCTDNATEGATNAEGRSCSAHVDCTCRDTATDLAAIASPHSGSIANVITEHATGCGSKGKAQKTFHAALEPNRAISIRQSNNNFNSVHGRPRSGNF